MKRRYGIVAVGSAAGVVAAAACSGSGGTMHGVEPDAMLMNPGDSMAVVDGPDGSPNLLTWVRFGQLVPELGHVDVCVLAPGASAWTLLFDSSAIADAGVESGVDSEASAADVGGDDDGASDAPAETSPSEGSTADAPVGFDGAPEDGGAPGAAVGALTLSRYVHPGGAGTFQLAVLPAGSTSCAGGYLVQPVTLDPDKHTTVVLVHTEPGPLGPPSSYLDAGPDATLPFTLLAFTDDPASRSASARTRFINAVTPSVADSGGEELSASVLDSTANLVLLASLIEPEMASSPSAVAPLVDALGYHDGSPTEGPLALRIGPPPGEASALPWTSATGDLALGPGSIHTAFILSAPRGTFEVLWCNDLTQDSAVTDCNVIRQ